MTRATAATAATSAPRARTPLGTTKAARWWRAQRLRYSTKVWAAMAASGRPPCTRSRALRSVIRFLRTSSTRCATCTCTSRWRTSRPSACFPRQVSCVFYARRTFGANPAHNVTLALPSHIWSHPGTARATPRNGRALPPHRSPACVFGGRLGRELAHQPPRKIVRNAQLSSATVLLAYRASALSADSDVAKVSFVTAFYLPLHSTRILLTI